MPGRGRRGPRCQALAKQIPPCAQRRSAGAGGDDAGAGGDDAGACGPGVTCSDGDTEMTEILAGFETRSARRWPAA